MQDAFGPVRAVLPQRIEYDLVDRLAGLSRQCAGEVGGFRVADMNLVFHGHSLKNEYTCTSYCVHSNTGLLPPSVRSYSLLAIRLFRSRPMTYSIAARCPQSGAFGIAVTSSSIAVAAR